jgi:predicted signal transduction protein with EAL and GGDEF domain
MIEIVKYKNKNAIRFTIYTSFLLVFALIELIHFYQNNFDTISLYSRIGMLLFVLMLGIDSGIKMKHAIRKNAEAELYERMAYTDILTGGKNRAAFEKDIDELTRHAELASLRLVMIDLNNLKAINDQYGRQEGDHAIKMCYECMNTVFTPSEEIRCYRFGGDDFFV